MKNSRLYLLHIFEQFSTQLPPESAYTRGMSTIVIIDHSSGNYMMCNDMVTQ